nr:MAG TPA: translation initiation factor-like protein [Caudoviricetes sp.]
MSLEKVIAENTQAINNLAELIRQAMHMAPPTAPAPVTPQAAPDNGIHVPPKPAPVPENPPFAAPAPAPAPQAVAQPAPSDPVDYEALRKELMQKVMGLFTQSRDVGIQILSSFGAKKLSDVPDDKLVAFAASVDKALAGV